MEEVLDLLFDRLLMMICTPISWEGTSIVKLMSTYIYRVDVELVSNARSNNAVLHIVSCSTLSGS